MKRRGVFISIEGGEKAGKTTQAGLLAGYLRSRGFDVVLTREPGGTPAGEAIRHILLHKQDAGLNAVSEVLLFAASRGQLVEEVVRPALRDGRVVVADRYVDSSLAYQAYGLGLPLQNVLAVNEWATGSLWPDLTVLLDLPNLAVTQTRPRSGPADRIERRSRQFHERLLEGYRTLAATYKDRYVVVDASGPVDEVSRAVQAAVLSRVTGEEVPGR